MKYCLLILLLCLLLSGCGKGTEPAVYSSVLGSKTEITLDAPAEPVLAALGTPFGYGERKSAAHRGVEKTYRFSGLDVRTYESRDGERILGVMITGGGFHTPEGITVGDTAARVRECFGPESIREGCCTVCRTGEQMVLTLENNVVTAITYSLGTPGKTEKG